MEEAENIFDGCALLLETFRDHQNQVQDILIDWTSSVPLDFYLVHPEKLTKFLSFVSTICHFVDRVKGSKLWTNILVFYNTTKRLEIVGEILSWSTKVEFSLDPLPELEWIGDLDFSLDASDPNLIANIMLLFGN